MNGINVFFHRGELRTAIVAVFLQASMLGTAYADEPARDGTTGPIEQPEDLFRTGLAEYDAGRYRRSIDIFSRAYEQTHIPAILFNIAQAWRLTGNCPKAVAMYEAFVADDPTSQYVDRAKGWLDRLRPCSDAPPSAILATPAVAASSHPAEAIPPPATSIGLVVQSPSAAAPSAHGHLLVVGILTGASIALIGGGSYAAWQANDLASQTTASFKNGGTWNSEAATIEREGLRAQAEAFALLSAGIVSGLAAYVIHRLSAVPTVASALSRSP
jgi:hypothetical protein